MLAAFSKCLQNRKNAVFLQGQDMVVSQVCLYIELDQKRLEGSRDHMQTDQLAL